VMSRAIKSVPECARDTYARFPVWPPRVHLRVAPTTDGFRIVRRVSGTPSGPSSAPNCEAARGSAAGRTVVVTVAGRDSDARNERDPSAGPESARGT
jgi:hypothetical protein